MLLTGILRVLRAHRPNWELHALVSSEAGPLLEGLPFVDRVIGVTEPKSKTDRLAFWLKMLRRLRSIRYDQVLNFHASFRTALVSQLLRTELCVANDHSLASKNRLSDLPVPGRGRVKSIIDRDLDVLRSIGISATVDDALPELKPTTYEIEEAKKLLGRDKSGGTYVFLGVGGSRGVKRWPAEHFLVLMEKLSVQSNHCFVLATVRSDEEWLSSFFKMLKDKPDLQKRILHFKNLPIRMAMAVLSQCDRYIGNDSGLKHIAAAVGVPTHTFFGPEAPLEWHPYPTSKHTYSFIEDLACRTETGKHWCPIETCERHGHKCLKGITPDEVATLLKGSSK